MSNKHRIRLPVFAIHGNHDDPVGLQMLSSLDQLNVNSYVNHFGKVMDIERIQVSPVLFSKGLGSQTVKIALFGIGHIKDERLNMAFENNRISWERPIDP